MTLDGGPGMGKTTVARALCEELQYDYIVVNASEDGNIDYLRNQIRQFASTVSMMGGQKVVIMDEADGLSKQTQLGLRGFIEEFSNNCRFILTCNYPNKVIPAIHSRCQGYHIEKLDKEEFMARVATILISEGVDLDIETLDIYVAATYPDLRKCTNMVQQSVVDGVLQAPGAGESGESDWILEYVAMFQIGNIAGARKLIVEKARPEEYEGVYRKLYENITDWFGPDEKTIGRALLCIRDGLVNHALVADPEINLSATLLELQYIAK